MTTLCLPLFIPLGGFERRAAELDLMNIAQWI